MSGLKEIIPGAEHWPRFMRNNSEQFEARVAMVEVQKITLHPVCRHGGFQNAGRHLRMEKGVQSLLWILRWRLKQERLHYAMFNYGNFNH